MPDTTAYYHAAYVVVAVLYGGYTASLWLRARRLRERGRALAKPAGESGARGRP